MHMISQYFIIFNFFFFFGSSFNIKFRLPNDYEYFDIKKINKVHNMLYNYSLVKPCSWKVFKLLSITK